MKKFINSFEVYLGAFCMAMMVLILFLQVFSRYVLRNSFSWSEELALIFFILSTYFGATAAIRTNQHLKLEILLSNVSEKTRTILEIVGNFFFSLFNVIILGGLIPVIVNLKSNGTVTAVTNIPKWIIYSALPFCFLLMLIRLIQDTSIKVKKLRELNN